MHSPGEISFDLVMEDNMPFVEGTYRLPDKPWEVLIFSSWSTRDVDSPRIEAGARWESGVTGVSVQVPFGSQLNKEVVMGILSNILGVDRWTEVKGPDSMDLR